MEKQPSLFDAIFMPGTIFPLPLPHRSSELHLFLLSKFTLIHFSLWFYNEGSCDYRRSEGESTTHPGSTEWVLIYVQRSNRGNLSKSHFSRYPWCSNLYTCFSIFKNLWRSLMQGWPWRGWGWHTYYLQGTESDRPCVTHGAPAQKLTVSLERRGIYHAQTASNSRQFFNQHTFI